MEKYYIEIKGQKIDVVLRKFKNSKKIKIYFREDILNVSMPIKTTKNQIITLLKQNENSIYDSYLKMVEQKKELDEMIKNYWKTGETILYLGETFNIETKQNKECQKIKIRIEKETNKFYIQIPSNMQIGTLETKEKIDKEIKKIFKNETYKIVQKKLPYWSEITNIQYKEYSVRDAISKFGSCTPKTGKLHFSARIIMLSERIIDAIIVHELCHFVHANHSEKFYSLVEKYIPEYRDIVVWLKSNGNVILF